MLQLLLCRFSSSSQLKSCCFLGIPRMTSFSFLLCITYLIVNFILLSQALSLFFNHSEPASSCTASCKWVLCLLLCTVCTSKVTLLLFPPSWELFTCPDFFLLFSTTTKSLKLQVCYPAAVWSRIQTQGKKKNIRHRIFANKLVFSNCSENFFLIDLLYSDPLWPSEFSQWGPEPTGVTKRHLCANQQEVQPCWHFTQLS